MPAVPKGDMTDHFIDSHHLGFRDRKVWIYTPPGYDSAHEYPLLLLMDARWCIGPLQVPAIADARIKHGRMQPAVIAMMESAPQEERARELISNDRHVLFLLTELLPFVRNHYRVNMLDVGIGGADVGAVAAAYATLYGAPAFTRLMMIAALKRLRCCPSACSNLSGAMRPSRASSNRRASLPMCCAAGPMWPINMSKPAADMGWSVSAACCRKRWRGFCPVKDQRLELSLRSRHYRGG
jgi:hypothetical protein